MQNTAGVTSFRKPVYWDEITAYAEAPGTSAAAEQRLPMRPSLEHSQKALEDLLAQVLFEGCTVNMNYLRALGLDTSSVKDQLANTQINTTKTD
jgi:hypothetical protein